MARKIEDWPDDARGGGGGTGVTTTGLQVVETAKLLYAISEGPCAGLVDGLKSIKLDGTPILAADGVTKNFKGVSVALVHGTSTQQSIPGFADVETEHSSGAEIKASQSQFITINDTSTSSVRVKISLNALQKINQTTGKPEGATVQIAIDLQASGGSYVAQTIRLNGFISGLSSGPTSQAYSIPLSGTGPWTIRVRRLTADSTDQYLQDKTYLSGWTEIKDAKLTNPWTAKLAIAFNARQFSNIPKVTLVYKGRKVLVPSNYNPVTRVYTGIWDGTFMEAWTDNPVWCFYDMATSERYGAGRYLAAASLDIWTLYQISQYCDGLVDDGKGGTEPRFRFNHYMTKDEETFKVLAHMISVARAQLFYGGTADRPSTSLTALQDVDGTAKALFSPSNVIGGKFVYTGTPRKTRYTEVTVWWNDPEQAYKLVPVLVQADAQYLARYGVQSHETTAMGCTSKGQAIREGRRILYTNLLEQEIVTFASGLEGIVTFPGDLVQIKDPGRDRKRQGGRLAGPNTTTSLVLDGTVTLDSGVAYTAWAQLADGTVVSRAVSTPAGTVSTLTLASALPSAPQAEAQWQVTPTATAPTRWRVLSIKENKGEESISFEITAVASAPEKYALLDQCGTIVSIPTDVKAFPPVTSLSLSSNSGWTGGNAIHTLKATWVMPTGATGAVAMARNNLGPWEKMTVSGSGATLISSSAGAFEVEVYAQHPRGVSPVTRGTFTVPGIPTTTPTSLSMTVL